MVDKEDRAVTFLTHLSEMQYFYEGQQLLLAARKIQH